MIDVSKDALYIIKKLNENGHEAYIVGGCVRDSIMKISPKDWDITTSAHPEEVKKIFVKTIDTGLKHGTVTVMMNKMPYEVTTYRIDGVYEDNRRPVEVLYTKDIIEDLKRRDFTMNAIAYHPTIGFVDPFNGEQDIKDKIIRAVGNADERFNEDALRMLRAIRFSAQLSFEIEKETLMSIEKNRKLINNISVERIRDEITKTILSDDIYMFKLLYDTKILEEILIDVHKMFEVEQVHPYHCYSVGMHSLVAVKEIEKIFHLKWTMLLHDIGKVYTIKYDNGITHFYGHDKKSYELSDKILNHLKFDNKSKKMIETLIKYHEVNIKIDEFEIRKLMSELGKETFYDLLKVKRADACAKFEEKKEEMFLYLNEVYKIAKTIEERKDALSIKELEITGNDLKNVGVTQGKEIGELLNKLFNKVLVNPDLNRKEILIKEIEEMIK